MYICDTIDQARKRAKKGGENIVCSIHGDRVLVKTSGEVFPMRLLRIFRIIEGFSQFKRPENVPESWPLFNAPRPFPASVKWTQGDNYLHGLFFGTIDPDAENREWLEQRLREQDCTRLVFVSKAEIMEWARPYYEQYGINADDYDYREIALGYLHHHENEIRYAG